MSASVYSSSAPEGGQTGVAVVHADDVEAAVDERLAELHVEEQQLVAETGQANDRRVIGKSEGLVLEFD
jgi:hypothetical protein